MFERDSIKNSLSLKLFIVGFLIAILMIPTGMIAILVSERESRQQEAFIEVSEKWGQSQYITGPVLTVPYNRIIESTVNGEKVTERQVRYAHFLPEILNITGVVKPETRKRGIYELAVYTTDLNFNGEFLAPDFSKWEIKPEEIMFNKSFVSIGIPDMRGIKEAIELKWDNASGTMHPGLETNEVLASGASTVVKIDPLNKGKKYAFEFKLVLNGSEDLQFAPVGKITNVSLNSTWTEPSFQGAFLPESYEISETGFKADWKVLELNRNFPQSFLGALADTTGATIMKEDFMKGRTIQTGSLSSSNFGVRLLIAADEYQKTVRALKYAVLMLALTFLTLFFFEALNKKRVHPLQYILIGLALSLFYVLLLSIAEQLGFNLAYLISTLATVGLIKLYSKSVFGGWRPAVIVSLILAFIYGFIFVILQLKDYSLLVGAIGLFLILALVMYISRKIDWFNK